MLLGIQRIPEQSQLQKIHGSISNRDINCNNSLSKLRRWTDTIVLFQIQLKSAFEKTGLKVCKPYSGQLYNKILHISDIIASLF